ncbi:MAG: hydrogenase maturation protease [Candidatus Atribacteria bacterium]|nr:hydrogenase maturation protease [Candidatus Atribacteria bacterium]
MKSSTKKLIIGIGNILLSDEGIGIHIVRQLQRQQTKDKEFFHNTEFIDIGTSSFDIISYINNGVTKVVLIDCMKADGYLPGTIFKLTPDDLRKRQKEKYSLHQMELVDTLRMISIIEKLPEILILWIVPEDINKFSTKLSDSIAEKFPVILSTIKKEIVDFFK